MKKVFVTLTLICLLLCSCNGNKNIEVKCENEKDLPILFDAIDNYDNMKIIYSRDKYIYGDLIDFYYDFESTESYGTGSYLLLKTESGETFEVKGFAPNKGIVNDTVSLNTILLRSPEKDLKNDYKVIVFFDSYSENSIHEPKDIVLFTYKNEEDARIKKEKHITEVQNLSLSIISNFESYKELNVIRKEQAIVRLIEVNKYTDMNRDVDRYNNITYNNNEIFIESGLVSYNKFIDENTEKYVRFNCVVRNMDNPNLMESYYVYADGSVEKS